MYPRIAFAVLETAAEAGERVTAIKARSLTVSCLRWCYQGDILEDSSVDNILSRASEQGYDYCFLQSYGHIIVECSGPVGTRPPDFLETLRAWLSIERVFAMGDLTWLDGVVTGIRSRRLLVNLRDYRRLGYPAFETGDGPISLGKHFLELARGHDLIVRDFPPALSVFLVDLGSNLKREPGRLNAISRQADQGLSGVFVLNFENYDDVEGPPPDFRPPVSVLYSVAAGLKPNRILETHGFNARTRLVYFDYSARALDFRRRLVECWDGTDLPSFLRRTRTRGTADDTHYYLWPGASIDDLDWPELDRLWRLELSRWGGEEKFLEHWLAYRTLAHDYILCNVLTEPQVLLDRIENRGSSVIWWSNVFSTAYSGWRFSLDDMRRIYEDWILRLSRQGARILLYGGDHGNNGVNGITAEEYRARYFASDGDPLRARPICLHRVRF